MTDEPQTNEPQNGQPTKQTIQVPPRRDLMALPALAAIGLYLLVLAAVIVLGVVGGHYPVLFLLLSVAFVTASAGLFFLFRWAWALTLSAVFLLASYYLWIFSHTHLPQQLVQGLLNLVFFLYMIRPEVRSKLR